MRKKYLKVESIYLYHLTNAELINFLRRFMALLPLEDDGEGGKHAPKLSITSEMVAEGNGYLETAADLNRQSKLKAETKPKKEIDRLRDRMVVFIIDRISFLRSSPDAAVAAAAELLYIVVKPYKGIGSLSYNRETEEITGLLTDLNKPENVDAVKALGIEKDIDDLKSYNDQFIALVAAADETSSTLALNEKMSDLRVQMIDWYDEMADRAFASNLLNESEESLYFVSGLNALIQSVEASYKQRIAQSKGNQDETTDAGELPTEN